MRMAGLRTVRERGVRPQRSGERPDCQARIDSLLGSRLGGLLLGRGRPGGDHPAGLVAYFGQHKCASAWCHGIMGRMAKKAGLRHQKFSRRTEFDSDLGAYVARHRLGAVSWVNAEYTLLAGLDCRGFHVVRDPRDILVSAYFSHLTTHPTENWPRLVPFREKLQAAG